MALGEVPNEFRYLGPNRNRVSLSACLLFDSVTSLLEIDSRGVGVHVGPPTLISENAVGARIVSNMQNSREWDVTIRGRIEHVTDQDSFPDLFHAALAAAGEISVIQFNYLTWPHTTSAVIRISADRKKDAEGRTREIMLRVFLSVARVIIGDQTFGWTLSTEAVPTSQSRA